MLPPRLGRARRRGAPRVEGEDLFGYGAREAVLRALAGDPADRAPFGAPAAADEVAAAVAQVLGTEAVAAGDALLVVPDPRLAPLAFAFGWALDAAEEGAEKATIRPLTP